MLFGTHRSAFIMKSVQWFARPLPPRTRPLSSGGGGGSIVVLVLVQFISKSRLFVRLTRGSGLLLLVGRSVVSLEQVVRRDESVICWPLAYFGWFITTVDDAGLGEMRSTFIQISIQFRSYWHAD